MTILTLLWRFTIGGAWKWLVAGAGLILLYSKGRADAKAKRGAETLKGIQAGAKGAAKAEADLRGGKTPEDIVRSNDSKWN